MKEKILIVGLVFTSTALTSLGVRPDSWWIDGVPIMIIGLGGFYTAVDLLLKEVKKSTANQQAAPALASGGSSISEA